LSAFFAASTGSTGSTNSLEGLQVSIGLNTRGADTRDCETHGKPIIRWAEGHKDYAEVGNVHSEAVERATG